MSQTTLMNPPSFQLSTECPIPWPTLSLPLLGTEQDSSQEQENELIRGKYERCLFLPEILAPIERFTRDLLAVTSSSSSSSSSSTSTLTEQKTDPLSSVYKELVLDLPSIESKYRKRLPPIIHSVLTGDHPSLEVQDEIVTPSCARAMKEGVELRMDTDGWEDSETKRTGKRLLDEFERREVLIQIIFLLTHIRSLPPCPPHQNLKKRKRKQSHPLSTPLSSLEILTDRLTVWQAIGPSPSDQHLLPPTSCLKAFSLKRTGSGRERGIGQGYGSGDGEEDWVKGFWKELVWPVFGGTCGKVCREMYGKMFGVAFVESLPVPVPLPQPGLEIRGMEKGKTENKESESKGTKRALSVIQSTRSRRSSIESTSGRQVVPHSHSHSHSHSSSTTAIEEDPLELETGFDRRGTMSRRTASTRVNSGMDLFKNREVGFQRNSSVLKNQSSYSQTQTPSQSQGQTPGQGQSQVLNGMGSLGRSSSSAMAGMSVILGKRKTMMVPKERRTSSSASTLTSTSNTFLRPTDPVAIGPLSSSSSLPTIMKSVPLQKSFSTSTLVMATPSKRKPDPRSQPDLQPLVPPIQPRLEAFVAETPSTGSGRMVSLTGKAGWEGTRQVLFPPTGGSAGHQGEDEGLADFMEDTDEEDNDGEGFFNTLTKRRKVDHHEKEGTKEDVVLFRTATGLGDEDHYLRVLARSNQFRPKCLQVLAQEFLDQAGLAGVIRQGSDRWSGIVATSKRAGEAWVAACQSVKRDELGVSEGWNGWSEVPLYSPGNATGVSFEADDMDRDLLPRRIVAAEETGSGTPLGQYILDHHDSLSLHPIRPLLILEGDKNTPDLKTVINGRMIYTQREVYRTGPKEGLKPDLDRLFTELVTLIPPGQSIWLAFFAPSSAKTILDCMGGTEWDRHLPLANGNRGLFRLVSVGNTTAGFLRTRGFVVDAVAEQPTPEGLRDAMIRAG